MAYDSKMRHFKKLPEYFQENEYPEIPEPQELPDDDDIEENYYDTDFEDDDCDYVEDYSEDLYDYIIRH